MLTQPLWYTDHRDWMEEVCVQTGLEEVKEVEKVEKSRELERLRKLMK